MVQLLVVRRASWVRRFLPDREHGDALHEQERDRRHERQRGRASASAIIAAWKPPVAGLKNDTARLGRPSAFAESSASLGSTLASMAQAVQREGGL